MNINRENYEVYALSYLEGEMAPSQLEEFIRFLIENPDISDEIDSMREFIKTDYSPRISLLEAHILKQDLNKQEVNIDTIEEFCIAWNEGDLTQEGKEKLTEFLSVNQSYKSIFDAYNRVYLEADYNISCNIKNRLKQAPTDRDVPIKTRILRISVITSFAAVFLMLINLVYNHINTSISTVDLNISTQMSSEKVKGMIMDEMLPVSGNSKLIAKDLALMDDEVVLKERIVSREKSNKNADSLSTREKIIFASLNAIQYKPISSDMETNIIYRESKVSDSDESEHNYNLIAGLIERRANFLFNVKDVTIDRILRESVNGINQMTESDWVYQSHIDKDGHIVAYSITTESFNFKRIRRN